MRRAFVRTLVELADEDPRIVLLTGDLGFMALEPFAERFPTRFFNAGVAEQNMLGVATGLAAAGFVPFVYSIVPFVTLRPYEFIRNGPVAHRLPVRIVGIGGGLDYGPQGITHHGLEDVGVLRVQPGLTIVAPADHAQLATALRVTRNAPGPVYFRLGRDDVTTVLGLDGAFALGQANRLRPGRDVVIVAMGSIAVEAAAAADLLVADGIDAGFVIVASVQPPPVDDLVRALAAVPLVVTVEAHYVTGGLGSLVAEVVAEHGLGCRVVRCGVQAPPDGVSGSQQFLHERHGLSRTAVAATVRRGLASGR